MLPHRIVKCTYLGNNAQIKIKFKIEVRILWMFWVDAYSSGNGFNSVQEAKEELAEMRKKNKSREVIFITN